MKSAADTMPKFGRAVWSANRAFYVEKCWRAPPFLSHDSPKGYSRNALSRIRSGRSQQIATIAEPTGLQGWQLADELRRAFAGQPPSGRVARPITVTTALLRQLGPRDVDDALPYRAEYRRQWFGSASGKGKAPSN